MTRKHPFSVLLVLAALAVPALAQPGTIALPPGFQPEGVVAGAGTTLYAGSLADGSIFQVDVATGEGSVLVPGEAGRVTVGLTFDPRTGYLYAAGGMTGVAHIFDTNTGTLVESVRLTDTGTFVNDAVVAGDAVYFTDSNRDALYRLELGPDGAPSDAASELALTGDLASDPNAFNANGVAVTEDGTLIIVKSNTGQLYRVDPETGETREIDLGGEALPNGDGLLLEGRTLYVVQNRDNQIAVVELTADLSSGAVTGVLQSPDFDVPTTVAGFADALYAVNARFGVQVTPETEYAVVRVPR
jgi:sugar lactone lactonase YvrE